VIKNGVFFVSVVNHNQVKSSTWDPHSYRPNNIGACLADYATISRVKGSSDRYPAPFSPLEYRHIPKGKYLTFMLDFHQTQVYQRLPRVGEQKLLIGTMRAYLRNILVTPRAEWIGFESPLYFPVKSEFVSVIPKDECVYFWWAYLQSSSFLKTLPLGSGGTRPRLHENALLETPVSVPSLEIRRTVHDDLIDFAELEWYGYMKRKRIIDSYDLS
jgi:hypothetical protein